MLRMRGLIVWQVHFLPRLEKWDSMCISASFPVRREQKSKGATLDERHLSQTMTSTLPASKGKTMREGAARLEIGTITNYERISEI